MKKRGVATCRLSLQTLESRITPSSVSVVNSTNWSGYAISSTNSSVSYVSGSWTVPTSTGSGTAYSSAWVGIDGYSSNSVEQLGTDSDVVNGKATYYAWYEMYPSASVTISSITVKAGDTVSASVSYSGGNFTLSITDGSQKFSITKSLASAARSSAEWIEEAPSSNTGVLPLADFNTISFSNAGATINGVSGSITASYGSQTQIEEINIVSAHGTKEDTTSSLNSAGTGFSVTWDSTGSSTGSGSTLPTPPAPPSPPSPPPPPPVRGNNLSDISELDSTQDSSSTPLEENDSNYLSIGFHGTATSPESSYLTNRSAVPSNSIALTAGRFEKNDDQNYPITELASRAESTSPSIATDAKQALFTPLDEAILKAPEERNDDEGVFTIDRPAPLVDSITREPILEKSSSNDDAEYGLLGVVLLGVFLGRTEKAPQARANDRSRAMDLALMPS